ncbi:MAG: ABC transporter permease [Bacteroidales bacterium]|jgi:lipoprotein-releasing system permease protein|nr:ABC transporter permease [Bacteroidales bacterium]
MEINHFISRHIGKKDGPNGKIGKNGNMIAIISVSVSIAVIITAVAVAGGFRQEIRRKASGYSGDITISSPGTDITNYEYSVRPLSYLHRIDSLPEVSEIYPVYYRQGILKGSGEVEGALFKGKSADDNGFFGENLCEGRLPDFMRRKDGDSESAASGEIMISQRMAAAMNYKAGSRVIAYFIGDDIKVRSFKVAGVYDAQLGESDKYLVIADPRIIRGINGWRNGECSGYEVLLKRFNDKNLDRAYSDIGNIIEDAMLDYDSSVVPVTVKQRYFALFDWLHLLDINVLIILILMIAVSGFNLISGILIILFEHIPFIGALKAMGMKNSNISGVFIYKAASIVLKGIIAGDLAAMAFCFSEYFFRFVKLNPANYFVKYVPVDISLSAVLLIDAAAFLLIMVSLLVPFRFISKVSPARALTVK